HEVGDGRLAPLLATARSGGITGGAADRQDRLDKFVIPARLRRGILRQLDAMNINPFSLFGTEESLMQMLAFREMAD
ncbi:hypothetical protein J7424_11195, partial [Xanthomonas phaseoli pv. phaseoli]|nr:hypothetical protein [Xanthomonas phaseoli pv. phaseoli]